MNATNATNTKNSRSDYNISKFSFFHSFISQRIAYHYAGKLFPCILTFSLILISFGTVQGFFLAPTDLQQGEGYRIIYVHVPAAFWSLAIYSFIFIQSVIYLVFRIKLADNLAASSASIGASFTFIALATGALWGKPMWGTWWVWDARLTSELILLFLYLGYLGLRSAIPDLRVRAKMASTLAIIGMVDVPIVHFSVQWWNTLHQGATLMQFAKPSISSEMLIPLLLMCAGFGFFFLAVLLLRLRTEIAQWKRESSFLNTEVLKPDLLNPVLFNKETSHVL